VKVQQIAGRTQISIACNSRARRHDPRILANDAETVTVLMAA
jgi:hypothetical protein